MVHNNLFHYQKIGISMQQADYFIDDYKRSTNKINVQDSSRSHLTRIVLSCCTVQIISQLPISKIYLHDLLLKRLEKIVQYYHIQIRGHPYQPICSLFHFTSKKRAISLKAENQLQAGLVTNKVVGTKEIYSHYISVSTVLLPINRLRPLKANQTGKYICDVTNSVNWVKSQYILSRLFQIYMVPSS